MSLIYTNRETDSNLDKTQVGGKGFFSLQLYNSKLNVPDFIVLSVALINQIIAPVRSEIERLINSSNNINSTSKEIEDLILSVKIAQEIKEKIGTKCEEYFGKNYRVAIRSSAVDEDNNLHSFAGQHKSYLYVNQTKLFEKIIKSIASAWSINALNYRKKKGISLQNILYAIVIQKMVNALKSGVGFSMNIQGNMADGVVVAGYGLGEGIVSDQIETDTYYINRLNSSISKIINTKDSKVSFNEESGLILSKVIKKNREIAVLSNDEIEKVSEVLKQTENLLGTISDIEFSFTEKNELFILQMRPVTGIKLSDLKILDNTNIVESYPGISLPLSFSFVKDAYKNVFINVANLFWVSSQTKESLQSVFENLLGYYQGRIYYRLDNWYRMMSEVFPSKKAMESWKKAVGLKNEAQNEKLITAGKKIKMFISLLGLLIRYKGRNALFFKKFKTDYLFLQSFKDQSFSEKELLEHLQVSSSHINEYWHYTLINDLISFKSFSWLQKIIKKHKIGAESLANDLLSGQIKSDSEKAISELLILKEQIIKDKKLFELFSKPNETIWQSLNENVFSDFKKKMQEFLEKYGDRTLAELKLETPSLRNDTNKFLNLLKSQLATNTDIYSYKNKQKHIYNQAIKLVYGKLKWWHIDSFLLKVALNLSKYGLKNRENMRFSRTRVYGVIKDVYLSIGTIMQEKEYIKEKKDVFYLNKEEIRDFSNGNYRKNLFKTIEKRKALFQNYALQNTPDRIVFVDKKPPIFSTNEFEKKDTNQKIFKGVAVSKGTVRAKAKIVLQPDYKINIKGKILVSKITDPGWVFLMSQSVGLISEKGSLLSHTAIIGRELGIPVVVGVEQASTLFKDDAVLEINGDLGWVSIIEK